MVQRKQIGFVSILSLVAVLLSGLFPYAVNADPPAFSGHGLGTTSYPYRITTCTQLQEMNNNLSASYTLESNIDCGDAGTGNDSSAWNAGAGFDSIGSGSSSFSGRFDGRNHTITDLVIDRPLTDHIGLFGSASGATIKNVTVANAVMRGQNFVGGLVGLANGTTIEHASVSGTVEGEFTVGGLVGRLDTNSSASKSVLDVTVINHGQYTGGIAGLVADSSIANVYATVDVDSVGFAGGITSYAYTDQQESSFTNIYIKGDITTNTLVSPGVARIESAPHKISLRNLALNATSLGYALYTSAGTLDVPLEVDNVYYNGHQAGGYQLECNPAGEAGCIGVNADGSDASYFDDYDNNNPFTDWDNFSDIWDTAGGILSLKDATIGALYTLSAPSNPNITNTTVGVDSIHVQWIPPGEDFLGGDPILYYELSITNSNGGGWSTVYPAADDSEWDFTGLTPGESYNIQILAVNVQGAGNTGGQDNILVVDPQIHDCTDLQNMSARPDGDYVLMNDIDCGATGISDDQDPDYNQDLYNNGDGFTPVQDFTGTLDGDGYVIYSLHISRPDDCGIGLFGSAGGGAVISDIAFEDSSVAAGCEAGGLIGYAYDGVTITGVSMSVYMDSNNDTGGLVGYAEVDDEVTISNSDVSLILSAHDESPQSYGGLIGTLSNGVGAHVALEDNRVFLDNSGSPLTYVAGIVGNASIAPDSRLDIDGADVTGFNICFAYCGGLVGYLESYWDPEIESARPQLNVVDAHSRMNMMSVHSMGGLIGELYAAGLDTSIRRSSYVENDSEEPGIHSYGANAGGLVGNAYDDSYDSTLTIEQSWVDGRVIGPNFDEGGMEQNDNVGGLVGNAEMYTLITDSYFRGDAVGYGAYGGGLVGRSSNYLEINRSYATGGFTGSLLGPAGGLVGGLETGAIYNSFVRLPTGIGSDGALGGVVGEIIDELDSSSQIYVDVLAGGVDHCYGTQPDDETCVLINTDPESEDFNPDYFLSNSTNAPLDEWDFETVWFTQEDDLPVLVLGDNDTPVYDVTTCAELQNIDADLSGEYRLMNDIDCSNSFDLNDGDGFSPIGRGEGLAFNGELDGQGHKITNLYITSWEDANNVGLFGQVEDAYLHDFTISGFVEGAGSVGGVVGVAYNFVDIERVGNHVDVVANDDYSGGLVGSSDDNLYVADSYNQAIIDGSRYVGGILGYTEGGASIHRSYNAGEVSGTGDVGGIAGVIDHGTVDSNFNAGLVEAANSYAAMIDNVGDVTFTNNYVDQDRSRDSGCISNVGGEECNVVNTTEDPDPDYFFNTASNAPFTLGGEANWDFDETWLTHRSSWPTLGTRINYSITSCADLTAINDDLAGHYTLANDIGPCSITPLAGDDAFTGALDGGYHSIDGLALTGGVNKALFQIVENAEIYNLTINDITTSGANCGGALAGQADGIYVYGVSVTGTVDTEVAGGFVGCLSSHTGNATVIEHSSFDGELFGMAAGGLIGEADMSGGAELVIAMSTSTGTLDSSTACGGLVGGVTYEWDGTDSRQAIEVYNASSSLAMSCNGNAGGLFGYIEANGLDLEISQSHFSGSIDANNYNGIGGLVGRYSSDGHTPSLFVDKSYAEASIVNGGNQVGGLVGHLDNNTNTQFYNSYFNGDIEMNGQNGGGLVGLGEGSALGINYSYAAGSITNFNDGGDVEPWTGGLLGAGNNVWFAFSFSAAELNMSAAQPFAGNGLVGLIGPDTFGLMINYYNASTGSGQCAYSAVESDYLSPDDCNPVDVDANPDMWIGNSADAPMSLMGTQVWDFENAWYVRPNDYPALRPSDDPQIECQQLTTTSSSINVDCRSIPSGWGTGSWEMQYREQNGSDSWHDVSLSDPTVARATIAGLKSGTDYRVQFRFTNYWGMSEWGHIDATTLGAAPASGGSTPTTTTAKAKASPNVKIVNTDADTPITTDTEQKISLNDFVEFARGQGKQLQLSVGEVIYFTIGNEEHSATVKEVGADYVVLVLRSTPQEVRLNVGQTGEYDVTGDGMDDIKITLDSIADGVAGLTFAQVWHTNMPVLQKDKTSASNLWWLVGVALLATALMYALARTYHGSRSDTKA